MKLEKTFEHCLNMIFDVPGTLAVAKPNIKVLLQ